MDVIIRIRTLGIFKSICLCVKYSKKYDFSVQQNLRGGRHFRIIISGWRYNLEFDSDHCFTVQLEIISMFHNKISLMTMACNIH